MLFYFSRRGGVDASFLTGGWKIFGFTKTVLRVDEARERDHHLNTWTCFPFILWGLLRNVYCMFFLLTQDYNWMQKSKFSGSLLCKLFLYLMLFLVNLQIPTFTFMVHFSFTVNLLEHFWAINLHCTCHLRFEIANSWKWLLCHLGATPVSTGRVKIEVNSVGPRANASWDSLVREFTLDLPSPTSSMAQTIFLSPLWVTTLHGLLFHAITPFKDQNVLSWQFKRDRWAGVSPPVLSSGCHQSCQCVRVCIQLPVPVLQREGTSLAQWGSAGTGGQHAALCTLSHQAPYHVWGQFVCPSWRCSFASTSKIRQTTRLCNKW